MKVPKCYYFASSSSSEIVTVFCFYLFTFYSTFPRGDGTGKSGGTRSVVRMYCVRKELRKKRTIHSEPKNVNNSSGTEREWQSTGAESKLHSLPSAWAAEVCLTLKSLPCNLASMLLENAVQAAKRKKQLALLGSYSTYETQWLSLQGVLKGMTSIIHLSVLANQFLPWVLALTSLGAGLLNQSGIYNAPFLAHVTFDHGVYHSNDK